MSLCEGGLDSCIVCHKDRKWRDCLLDIWLIKLVVKVGLDNDVFLLLLPIASIYQEATWWHEADKINK